MTLLDAPWTLPPSPILEHFSVDPDFGLSAKQAANHALLHGKNGAPFFFRLFFSPRHPTRATRGAPNTLVAPRPRTVQGPARPHPPRLCGYLLPPRAL